MKKIKTLLGILFGFLVLQTSFGQQITKEVTQELSNKAKRGFLGNVVVDESRQQLDLVFVTKQKSKLIKFESYQYDFDLNLLDKIVDEQEIEKAKTKYTWFKFKGESYVVEGITAQGNLTGTFVLKKKQITYNYSWFTGGYRKRIKTLNKIKYKDANGRKMWFIGSYDNDQTGEICALAGIKGGGKDPFGHFKKMQLMRVGTDLSIKSETTIDLKTPYQVIYSGTNEAVDPTTDAQSDWYVILTPMGAGVPKKEKNTNPQDLVLLQISPEGVLKQKTNINSKLVNWKINGVYEKDGAVFVYGPGDSKGAGKSFAKLPINPEQKFPEMQLVKIANKKTEFVAVTNLDEFKSKAVSPEDQKKTSIYNGKKVAISNLYVAKNGELFVTAQDYTTAKDGHKLYKDLFLFHFDNQGKLRSSFGFKNEVKKGGIVGGGLADPRYYPAKGGMIENSKGIFWLLELPYLTIVESEYDYSSNTKTTTYYPKTYPKMIKIDPNKSTIEGVENYGDQEHFLMDEHPTVSIDNGNKIFFIGETKNQKTLWIGKLDFNKLK